MKKLSLLLFMALLSVEIVSAAREKVKIGNLYYELPFYGETVTVTYKGQYWGNSPYKGDVVIPEKVTYKGKEYVVNEIGNGAFYNCQSLTSVTIPNTVEVIGDMAFDQCFSLTTIRFGDKVRRIGRNAFRGCKLTHVMFPQSVKYISDYVFSGCEHLESIVVPEDAEISSGAFESMKSYDCVIKTHSGKPYTPKKKQETFAEQPQADLKALPILDVMTGSLAFEDATGNNVIGANGKYAICFQLKNMGKGVARGCTVKLSGKGSTMGLNLNAMKLPEIAVGESKEIKVPITSGMNVEDGEVELAVQVDEPNGFGTDPQYITVKTRAFEAPMVQVTDYTLTADGGQTLKKKQPFDLQIMLQNTKNGRADDVQVSVEIPQNVLLLEGETSQQFASLQGGEAKSLVYSLIVNNNFVGTTIPVKVHVKERHGKYAEDRTINLTLDQALASAKIKVDERRQQPKGEVTVARLSSDVDKDIPQTTEQQAQTFAVIIANEHYQKVPAVPYAQNDARVFAEYCRQTLGVQAGNIRSYEDATYGTLIAAIDDIKSIAEAYKGDISVIFYYAGHGVPNETTREAYLLPVDADGRNTAVCYAVSQLYKELGSLKARHVVVFMDACFSGSQRGEGNLAQARSVAIKAKAGTPQGQMVVFSAAQGDETAYPLEAQKHGLFTYHLLKKLQASQGNCSLGELCDYVQQQVRQQSVVINHKSQTPTVSVSTALGRDWRTMKLK